MYNEDKAKSEERILKEAKFRRKNKIRTTIVKILFFGGLIFSVISNFIVPFVLNWVNVEFSAIYDVFTIINGIAIVMIFAGIILWLRSANKSSPEMTEEELRNLAKDDYPRGWK